MRVLNFADGFTSSSAPEFGGASLESHLIGNNTTDLLFTLDHTKTRSMFADFELVRKNSNDDFIQTGSFIIAYSGTWTITFGNFSGDDLINDPSIEREHIKLTVNPTTGDVEYISNEMIGSDYVGTLKLSATRIS